MKLRVTFGARALVGANDGLDRAESASRYARALEEVLRREWPSAEIEVTWTDDVSPTRAQAEATTDTEARSIERSALDLAWVVKGTSDWARRG
jgi:hypothetical protein